LKRARSATPNTVREETPQEAPKEAPKEFYTVSQLAELLQLTEMTIYRMVNQGKLPCYCIGRIKRFRHEDIEEFLQACRVPAKRSRSQS
jgi:excisionase family DNA binding protein